MSAVIKRRKDRTLWRVGRGRLEPFDAFTAAQLRDKGYRVGDVLSAELTKPRNPGFHRLAHQLGSLLAENLDAFEGVSAHTVLKRLQIEGNIACDEIALVFPGIGPCVQRIPQSLSFASMDESTFRQTIAAMCRYVARHYWPTCSPEEIERMASVWVEAT